MVGIKQNIRHLYLSVFALVALYACESNRTEYITIDGQALGTFVQVKCEKIVNSDEIINLVKRVDKEAKMSMSIFDQNSLLSQINRNETDSLDCHILHNLTLARSFYELSNGAYDVTIKPLTEAWGFAAKQPSKRTPNIDSLLVFVGFDKISVDGNRLIKRDSRTQLDFNSIAKGYTVDLLAAELERLGIDDYMVNIGGEIRCHGANARGEAWSVGVETPREGNMGDSSFEKILRKTDCAIATSGNYRRFYIADDGRKVAHTIDPHTGYSTISNLLSATVIAPTCAEADAAATMLMSLGSEGGALEVAKRCEKERGWLYYLIYADGEEYHIECSDEFK